MIQAICSEHILFEVKNITCHVHDICQYSLVERSPPETLLKRCSQFKKHSVCISIKDSKDFLIQSAPATKLLPYGFADIKFLCQWYEKTSFLRNSLHWHKKHMSVQENQRKSLQWHKKNMSAPGKNECWRKNVMSGPEKMKEKT